MVERLTVRPPPDTPRPMGPEDLHFLLLPSGRSGQQFYPDEQEGQLGRAWRPPGRPPETREGVGTAPEKGSQRGHRAVLWKCVSLTRPQFL